jgi:hypothetical protein
MRREGEQNTGGGFLSVLLRVFCHQERREEAAGKETAVAIEKSRGQVAELNRPAPLHHADSGRLSRSRVRKTCGRPAGQSERSLESGLPADRILLHHLVHDRGGALRGVGISHVLSGDGVRSDSECGLREFRHAAAQRCRANTECSVQKPHVPR